MNFYIDSSNIGNSFSCFDTWMMIRMGTEFLGISFDVGNFGLCLGLANKNDLRIDFFFDLGLQKVPKFRLLFLFLLQVPDPVRQILIGNVSIGPIFGLTSIIKSYFVFFFFIIEVFKIFFVFNIEILESFVSGNFSFGSFTD